MKITVAGLKERLEAWPEDMELVFSGGLDFYRLEKRGEKLLQIEFRQNVYKDSNAQWRVDDPG